MRVVPFGASLPFDTTERSLRAILEPKSPGSIVGFEVTTPSGFVLAINLRSNAKKGRRDGEIGPERIRRARSEHAAECLDGIAWALRDDEPTSTPGNDSPVARRCTRRLSPCSSAYHLARVPGAA